MHKKKWLGENPLNFRYEEKEGPRGICKALKEKLHVVVLAWNPSAWEVKFRGSVIEGQPTLHSEFKASLELCYILSQNKTKLHGC